MDSAPTPVRQSNLVSSPDLTPLSPPPPPPPHSPNSHTTISEGRAKKAKKANTLLALSRALRNVTEDDVSSSKGKTQTAGARSVIETRRQTGLLLEYGPVLLNVHFRSDMIRLTRDNG